MLAQAELGANLRSQAGAWERVKTAAEAGCHLCLIRKDYAAKPGESKTWCILN
jgi:hypothetical protein